MKNLRAAKQRLFSKVPLSMAGAILATSLGATSADAAVITLQPGEVLTTVEPGDTVQLGGTFTLSNPLLRWGFNLPAGLSISLSLNPTGFEIFTRTTMENEMGQAVTVQMPEFDEDPFFSDWVKDGEIWTVAFGGGTVPNGTVETLNVFAGVPEGENLSVDNFVTTNPVVTNEPTPSPVPLPAAAWLLMASLGGLFGFKRLSSRKQAA